MGLMKQDPGFLEIKKRQHLLLIGAQSGSKKRKCMWLLMVSETLQACIIAAMVQISRDAKLSPNFYIGTDWTAGFQCLLQSGNPSIFKFFLNIYINACVCAWRVYVWVLM